MEKITEKYEKLLELKITHNGFRQEIDEVGNWLLIRPSIDCEKVMKQNRIFFKESKMGFLLIIQTKNGLGNEKKALSPINNLVLHFNLAFTTPFIASKTALPLKDSKKYIFSNDNPKITSSNLALPPPQFNNAIKYQSGEIVKDGANHKIAVFDYTKPPDQNRIKLVSIANWNDYVTTENLDNVKVEQGFGQIKIVVSNQLSAGFNILSNTEELISPTFEIRFLNI